VSSLLLLEKPFKAARHISFYKNQSLPRQIYSKNALEGFKIKFETHQKTEVIMSKVYQVVNKV
jgi:hypothetical protein